MRCHLPERGDLFGAADSNRRCKAVANRLRSLLHVVVPAGDRLCAVCQGVPVFPSKQRAPQFGAAWSTPFISYQGIGREDGRLALRQKPNTGGPIRLAESGTSDRVTPRWETGGTPPGPQVEVLLFAVFSFGFPAGFPQ